MKPIIQTISLLISALFLLSACEEDHFVPKPKGYPHIELPDHAYRPMEDAHPYSFEYSQHAMVYDDTFNLYEPHWIHVFYPKFKALVQITYKDLKNDEKNLDELVNDALRLANKHNIKAYAIEENIVKNDAGHDAVLIRLQGDVPSYFQFYMTDTTHHFIRAALYFPTATKADSLAPIINYIQEDMLHMVQTLRWN